MVGGFRNFKCGEFYDTFADKWSMLPVDLPVGLEELTTIPIKKRFIYAFGGNNFHSLLTLPVFRMDVHLMSKGWTSIELK